MSWDFTYSPYVWPMLATAGFQLAMVIYTWRRRSVPGAVPFMFTAAALVFFGIGAALVLAATDPLAKIFWRKFQVLWLLPAVTAELCFLLEYANLDRWLTRRSLSLLTIPSLVVALLIITDNAHHLMWTSFAVGRFVQPVRAWGGWVFITYTYALAVASSGIVIWLFMRSPVRRLPAALCLCGQLAPRIAFFLWPPRAADFIDSTVVASTFAMAMYAVALFGLGMFELFVVARGTMIEQMREGVLVLDPQERVVDLNPAAAQILGVSAARARGTEAARIFPEWSALSEHFGDATMAQSQLSIQSEENVQRYELNISSLKSRKDFQLGYLILLHDVTEKERAQEQLLEHQRALATLQERDRVGRELHDSLGQVLGFVKMQAQAARVLLAQGQPAQADRHLNQLASVAQDAHTDVREYILAARTGVRPDCEFLPALENYLQQLRENYGLATELKVAPELTHGALTPMVRAQLLRIIQEALTNVRKHAQTSSVNISLGLYDGHAEVIVQDGGKGFDPAAVRASSGQKYGLRFMEERAAEVGGNVHIHSAPGAGTQVIINVPLVRELA